MEGARRLCAWIEQTSEAEWKKDIERIRAHGFQLLLDNEHTKQPLELPISEVHPWWIACPWWSIHDEGWTKQYILWEYFSDIIITS
ncbi:hypothetical protein Vadar_018029 [Vaccinium darrowii]|uniref:Uncharacterized protein n=1 Tax=Vaccinium darrowii TaxID=229202 RepID=A0ACB7XAS9_9ERIC|nr:hypothetical protein Vadar_018029 [Vaccinium darrowii]